MIAQIFVAFSEKVNFNSTAYWDFVHRNSSADKTFLVWVHNCPHHCKQGSFYKNVNFLKKVLPLFYISEGK